ncbi:LppX_LprAFG lipoprotein [Janibacter sp. RAF52]
MRTVAMALAATATLALAACGGDGGPGPTAGSTSKDAPIPSSTPSASASSTAPSSTSKGAGTTSSSSQRSPSSSAPSSTSTDTGAPFDADEFTSKLEAAVDANPTVALDVRIGPKDSPAATATGKQDLADNALEMEVSVGSQQLTYRLVDGQYYLAQPPKWVPVTKDSTNPLIQQALSQTELLSMRTQLDAFIAGVESAGDKGTEEVDGVSTTHYTATVRTADVRRELGLDQDPNGPATAIYDVWLDDDDLIRKMSFTQNGAEAELIATDWGEPLTISKPTSSELAKVG